MRYLFIVNGKPRAGKDTVVALMATQFEIRGWATTAFSSIDPVRNLLSCAGLDVSKKTPLDRAVLAEVGSALEKHSKFKTEMAVAEIMNFFCANAEQDAAFFLHMREPDLIEEIKGHSAIEYLAIKPIVLFIEGRGETVTSNSSDARVGETATDQVIVNDANLHILTTRVGHLVWRLLGEDGIEQARREPWSAEKKQAFEQRLRDQAEYDRGREIAEEFDFNGVDAYVED